MDLCLYQSLRFQLYESENGFTIFFLRSEPGKSVDPHECLEKNGVNRARLPIS
jgi:hypothetical protein